MSHTEKDHAFALNLALYNMTCRLRDFLYFESNNFIRKCILTNNMLYITKKDKSTIAKLLAFNIFDPVLQCVADHCDQPPCSAVTIRGSSLGNLVSLN